MCTVRRYLKVIFQNSAQNAKKFRYSACFFTVGGLKLFSMIAVLDRRNSETFSHLTDTGRRGHLVSFPNFQLMPKNRYLSHHSACTTGSILRLYFKIFLLSYGLIFDYITMKTFNSNKLANDDLISSENVVHLICDRDARVRGNRKGLGRCPTHSNLIGNFR